MYFDWAYYKFIGVNLPVCITMGSITCLGSWLIVLCMYTRSLSTIFHQFIMSSVSNVITSIHSLPLHLFTLFYLSIYAFVYLSVYPLNLELTFIVICSGYIYVFFFLQILYDDQQYQFTLQFFKEVNIIHSLHHFAALVLF